MKVLVTGGAGYIGHTIGLALEESGHTPVVMDSLVTGREEFTKDRAFYKNDIADAAALERIFKDHPDIVCTIHCAALVVVGDSMTQPYEYYRENVTKSMELFMQLQRLGRGRVVFSSSASIYDDVPTFMVTESAPLKPLSPYARTKYMMEMVLQDFCRAYAMKGIALRYFNPIGADPKMRGGVHVKEPTHVLGKLVDTALGKLPEFQITGTDYATRDGSGLRDYVHVWDLARAHVKAVERFDQAFANGPDPSNPYLVINLGTGTGVTVKELVAAFERVWGSAIKKREAPRRAGDVAGSYANCDRASALLGWKAELSIDQGISDALAWGKAREKILRWR